jgi:uncharacterized protein (TIGR02466 family)
MNMSLEQKITPLFSTPIYSTILDLNYEINDAVVSAEYERVIADNGFMTKNKNLLDDIKLSGLRISIIKCISEFMHDIIGIERSIQFKIVTSWANKHIKNDFAHSHHHSNSYLSGVLFVITPPDSGNLRFHKNPLIPTYNNSTITLDLDKDSARHIVNLDVWDIKPGRGKLILFPSHLTHSVTKNLSDQERYTIAFNVFISGTIGKDGIDKLEF